MVEPDNANFEQLIQTQQAAVVDESYMMVGAHIDEAIQKHIVNNEYVDFARLLAKDRIAQEEDGQMEIVHRGGSTYFVPVSDRETAGGIHNFSKWEQAFRVFSNIYTKAYPFKAVQLIQYNHTIHSAAQAFQWDNVYRYDKEFHMHMSNFPHRSWGIILQ